MDRTLPARPRTHLSRIDGAQVMKDDGTFAPATIHLHDGRITAVHRHASPHTSADVRTDPDTSRPAPAQPAQPMRSQPDVLDATGHWIIPGVTDCHTHLGWTTFLHHDTLTTPDDRLRDVAPGLLATLRAGVTTVRDAGGAEAQVRDALARGALAGPRMQTACALITADDLVAARTHGTAAALRAIVARRADEGADWIKIVATGGVTAPEGTDLSTHLAAEEIHTLVAEARARDLPVMVHAWGGPALTDAIAAGASSVEHAMFLTDDQARAAARSGVVLVPTLTVYADVARMAARGELPPHVQARARRVVDAHPRAVRRALAAGVQVALGSDFGTTGQHGRNLAEIDALARAGLGAQGALLAATRTGARLLGTGPGTISAGAPADLVLLREDPADSSVFLAAESVASVVLGGFPAL